MSDVQDTDRNRSEGSFSDTCKTKFTCKSSQSYLEELLFSSKVMAAASTNTAWFPWLDATGRHWGWWRLELVRAESWSRLSRRWRHAGHRRIAGQLFQTGSVEGGRVRRLVVARFSRGSSLPLGWSAAAGSNARCGRVAWQGNCLPGRGNARVIAGWVQQLGGGRRCVVSGSGRDKTGGQWTLLVEGCQQIGLA